MTGLINSSGTQVVAYTYDAWGNPLTTTGTMADTLGKLNPFGVKDVELPSQMVGQFVPIG